MSIVRAHMCTSLDGFTSGVNQRFEKPFGDGTDHLNDWLFRVPAIRTMFGLPGEGEAGPSADVFTERTANIGAFIMGRNMFGGGPGPWKQEPRWDGWWGEEPPYHVPVYVLTHHARPSLEMKGGTTFHFVTDGPEAALRAAKQAAGAKDVVVAGGAHAVRQYLRLGAIDELELHLVPVVIGAGDRLLDDVGALTLEQLRVVVDRDVTHLRYRVVR